MEDKKSYFIYCSRGRLTGFHFNGGWKIGDVFACSKNSWISFETEQKAQEYLLNMKKLCLEQEKRWGNWLDIALKFWKTLKVGYKFDN